jgi:hypothetical protein
MGRKVPGSSYSLPGDSCRNYNLSEWRSKRHKGRETVSYGFLDETARLNFSLPKDFAQ